MARRKLKLVDLCKLNTDAFRHMTREQLARVKQQIGSYLDFTKAELYRADGYGTPKKIERKSRHNNVLVMRFVKELENRFNKELSPQSAKAYREAYKEEPMPQTQIWAGAKREADRLERAIWDLQTRASCAIPDREAVARDAAREGRSEMVAKIRRKTLIR